MKLGVLIKKTSVFEHGVLVSIVHTILPNCTLRTLLQYTVHTCIIHSVYLYNTQCIPISYTVYTFTIHSVYFYNTQCILLQYTVYTFIIHSVSSYNPTECILYNTQCIFFFNTRCLQVIITLVQYTRLLCKDLMYTLITAIRPIRRLAFCVQLNTQQNRSGMSDT